MPITLYWTLISQPSRAVKCLLQIGTIEHNLVEIDLMGNETKSKDYLSINPLGQIPFLVDGDFKLAESSAILVYLCEKFPQLQGYYGSTSQERGLVNQFLSAYQSIYRPALFKIIFLKIYKGMKRRKGIKSSEIETAKSEMMNAISVLQVQLKQSKTQFLTGAKFTIADLLYFFEMTNLILYEIKLQQFTEVDGWFNRMMEVEEVRGLTEKWQEVAPFMIDMFKKIPTIEDSKL